MRRMIFAKERRWEGGDQITGRMKRRSRRKNDEERERTVSLNRELAEAAKKDRHDDKGAPTGDPATMFRP